MALRYPHWNMGTTVANPTRRSGESGYVQCVGCKKWCTKLGVGRHWSHCEEVRKIRSRRKT